MEIIEINKATLSSGGKATGLAFLSSINIPVPNGFVIKESGTINQSEISTIKKHLENLNPNAKLAIRSSATAEDGKDKSFAGVFDTQLNVNNDIESVINAIKTVNDSIQTTKTNSYSDYENQNMNIIVQEMIEPKISGVLFTSATDINGDNVVLIECVEGLADKLVSGETTASQVIINVKNNHIDIDNIRVSGKLMDLKCLYNLFEYINIIKDNSESELDIEWCIDHNEKPFFVQARPITSTVFINRTLNNHILIASKGYAQGMTYTIEEPFDIDNNTVEEQLEKFPQGAILVSNMTSTDYLPAMKKAKGIITEEGASLSHAAIVSRELGIPCIVGYKEAIDLFPTGTQITLDALNGVVTTNDTKNKLDNYLEIDFSEIYCIDNYFKMDFGNFYVFFEAAYDGLYVHLRTQDSIAKNVMEIEKYARKLFKTSPIPSLDTKYYIYKQVELNKKLPFYNKYLNIMKKIVETKDENKINDFYEKSFYLLKELDRYREEKTVGKETIIFYEAFYAIYLILDTLLPNGYAIINSFYESISLLKKYNLSFSELLYKDNNLPDNELIIIQKFLSAVSDNKNRIYGRLLEENLIIDNYYDFINNKVSNEFKNNNITSIDDFYNLLEYEDYININIILNDFFDIYK